MPVSCRVDPIHHIGCMRCTAPSSLEDFERAISQLLQDAAFQSSFGLLLELGSDTALLAPTRAALVIERLINHRERLRGPIAVCVIGMAEFTTGRLIAMLGRHHGLAIEAFRDQPTSLTWLAQRVAAPAKP